MPRRPPDITEAMQRTLRLVLRHGAVERHWNTASRTTSNWYWTIGGEKSPPRQVDIALQRGFLVGVGATRDRLVLTDTGRHVANLAVVAQIAA